MLCTFLFTIYMSDLTYNSELRHLQKFSDDTAIVGCVEGGLGEEYRDLVDRFDKWCWENPLQLNVVKTKEILVDFRKNKALPPPVCISGSDMEIVTSYKKLGVHMNDKLEWSTNTAAICEKGLS